MKIALRLLSIAITAFLLQAAPTFAAENSADNFTKVDDLDDSEFEIDSVQSTAQPSDPLEKYNRKIHNFNEHFDRYFFRHIALAYRESLPNQVRKSIRNFITNIYLPISFVNSLAQGKIDNSLATFSHFLINTTLGVGGLFDVASKKQIRYNQEDFGQTLGHYNFGAGAYLVLPFLGPSSTRDFSGMIVDKSVNPLDFGLIEFRGEEFLDPDYRFALSGVNAVDKRESLLDLVDDIRKDSFDPYATIRSAYLQKRLNDIQN